jgi:hypothetical protein
MNRAVVTGFDGRKRVFVGECCFEYITKSSAYRLESEPDGRGWITLRLSYDGSWVLANTRLQPKEIVAETWAGGWMWKRRPQ